MDAVKTKKVKKARDFKQALYPKTSGRRNEVFDYLKSDGRENGGKLSWRELFNVCSSLHRGQLFSKDADGNLKPEKKTDEPGNFARDIKELGKSETKVEWDVEISGTDEMSRKVVVTL